MKDSGKFIKIKVIQLKSHKFDSTSLLFGQMGYRRGINILEIIQIPKNIVTREFRERPRVIDKLITPGQKNYIFHHLLPLANEIEQLSYEIVISNHKINIRLYITHNGYLSEEKLKFLLKEKSYMVEFAYKSIFKNIEFKNLVGVELEEAWGDVIGYGNYPYKIINNEIIEIDRRSSKLYISVLYLDSSSQIRADQTLTQIDLLINNILSHEIDAHYISVIQPSSNYYFSKNHKENQFIQSENPPKEGVEEDRLEPKINDKMLDVRHSELVQIWDCSTYIVLKSLFSEILEHNVQKVKNIFRNVFSNSNSTGVIKILRKKELRNALSRIIMRDRVNTIKMSTEQLISSFHLPERTFQYFSAGEKIPFFEIPGELEKFGKDKFVIGTSMYGDQLVNNVYLDAEELLYNLAVLGQTKTGKTEFVKNILSSLFEANPSINWIILDWRGEYNDLKDRINSHIEIIKIGSNKKPLKINI
ncbi:MAG: helicase HerA domain-containing protein, partial [Candidatus Hodarchaeota archaeon]